jgi:thrombospondin type 3 repeat protein
MALEQLSGRLRALLIPGVITFGGLVLVWGAVRLVRGPTTSVALPSPTGTPTAGTPLLEADTFQRADLVLPSAEVDGDADGLSDALEELYRTDPLVSDTDGDGYIDGTEVANGYDPTIPSPNDKVGLKLTGAASPGPTTSPGSPPPAPTPLPAPTLTEQFFSQTGIAPSKENLFASSSQLEEFVADVNARGFLPAISDEDIQTTSAEGKAAIKAYLDGISLPQNPALKSVTATDIASAFQTFTKNRDVAPLDRVLADLAGNVEALRAVRAPSEVRTLHKTYLAAAISLRDNARALKGFQADIVGAIVAASRIEGLRGIFAEIERDIKALEKKYGIT